MHDRPLDAGDPETAGDRIRIALIEDNCLVREGLMALLGRSSDFETVAAGSDDYSAALAETDPDVVLLEFRAGNQATLEFVQTLRSEYPGLRVILMDLLPTHEGLVDLISAGVWGFVHRGASLEEVWGTIQAVTAGLKVLPDEITGTLFSEIASRSAASGEAQAEGSVRLTPRETEIVDLVGKGLSNKAIGRSLQISVHTVKSHLRNVMDKLDFHSRMEIARYVHENDDIAELQIANRRPAGAAHLDAPTTDGQPGETGSRTRY
jgi:DNA-binding NarL/FixJ family response regulator